MNLNQEEIPLRKATARHLTALVLMTTVLLVAGVSYVPAAMSGCPAPPLAFGSKDKLMVGVEGKIYFLGSTVRKFPDFIAMKSEGSIYTAKWNVPERIFTEGFPVITDRFEWFAIDYQGTMYVSKPGIHGFRMASDDGLRLTSTGTW